MDFPFTLPIPLTTSFPLISATFVFCLGLLVFFQNRHKPLNILFGVMSGTIVVWLAGTFMMFLVGSNDELAIFWDRFIYIGVVYMPTLEYHFGLAYTKTKNTKLLYCGYFISTIFLILSRTDYFVAELFKYKWGVHTIAGPAHHIFLAFFFFYVFAFLFVLFKYYKQLAEKKEKTSVNLLLSAFMILNLVGGLGYLPAYKIAVFPISLIAPSLFVLIVAYVINKYAILNVKTFTAYFLSAVINIVVFNYIFIAPSIKEFFIRTIFFLIILIISLLLTKSFKKEQLQGEQLKELNEQLEHKVFERTRELKESKTQIETIVENLIPGLIEYNDNFTILRINRSAEKMLGVKRADILEKKIKPEHINNKEWRSLAIVLYPILSSVGKATQVDTVLGQKDIKENEVLITYPLKKELSVVTLPLRSIVTGEQTRFIKLIRDITKEKAIDRSKSEFISIAAHQLRTPLSATRWALRALLDGDMGEVKLTEAQKKMLLDISDTNSNLISIVGDLLDVTAIEEVGARYNLKFNNLSAILEDINEKKQTLLRDKQVDFIFKKTEDLPPFMFDRVKIMIALKNIIENAIDYTPNGGSVTVTLSKEDNTAIVTVTDTGIGISKEEQEQLFTKFYRSENARKMETDRSGLGLWITKQIIEKHNGTITVLSDTNKGTTVKICLPMIN